MKLFSLFLGFVLAFFSMAAPARSEEPASGYCSLLQEAESLSEVCVLAYDIMDQPVLLGMSVADEESLSLASSELESVTAALGCLAERLRSFDGLPERAVRDEVSKVRLDMAERLVRGRALKEHLDSMDAGLRSRWLEEVGRFSSRFRELDPLLRKYLKR